MANRKVVVPGGGSADGPVDISALQYKRSKSGTNSVANGSAPFASSSPSGLGMIFTPTVLHITSHDANSLATCQSWSASGFTMTARKVDFSGSPAVCSNLGTVNYSWTGIEG